MKFLCILFILSKIITWPMLCILLIFIFFNDIKRFFDRIEFLEINGVILKLKQADINKSIKKNEYKNLTKLSGSDLWLLWDLIQGGHKGKCVEDLHQDPRGQVVLFGIRNLLDAGILEIIYDNGKRKFNTTSLGNNILNIIVSPKFLGELA